VRHASFFSGVGGLDLGFERAGIETVSVSEIDPYANAVLAERFPDAPNLGDIVKLAEQELGGFNGKVEIAGRLQPDDGRHSAVNQISQVGRRSHWDGLSDWRTADIWSGGFPCQDLSVAGKRAGFAGKRSSLAFTFLDLVEQRRPRWLVLENVPGLFSSNHGADFARLLHEMEQLGYSVAWRTLDARYFGVPQRRRRVFIVASLEPDRAAEVLFECEGCERHPAPSRSQREGVTSSTPDGSGIAGAITGRFGKGVNSTIDEPLIISASADTDGVREVDGVARRLDNQPVVAYQTRVDEKHGNFTLKQADVVNSLSAMWPGDTSHRSMTLVQAVIQDSREMANKTQNGAGFSTEDISYTLTGVDRPAVFRKSARAQTNEDSETWVEGDVANTLNSFDVGDIRTTHAVVGTSYDGFNQKLEPDGAHRTLRIGRDSSDFVIAEGGIQDDPLLPDKLDGHRYRCCGNGVVAPVAEWIGRRIVEVDRRWREEDK